MLEIDIIGEAFNMDSKPVVAISYGVASNAKYTINENNGVNYIKPEMVSNIPDIIPPPKQGPLEAVDEVLNYLNIIV
jgi:molybdopterin-guanine dinucleotide biosynthesis protein A